MVDLSEAVSPVVLSFVEVSVLLFTANAILFNGGVRMLEGTPINTTHDYKIRSAIVACSATGLASIGFALLFIFVRLYGLTYEITSLPTGPKIGPQISMEIAVTFASLFMFIGVATTCIGLPVAIGLSFFIKMVSKADPEVIPGIDEEDIDEEVPEETDT
jgi:hypothetical protein